MQCVNPFDRFPFALSDSHSRASKVCHTKTRFAKKKHKQIKGTPLQPPVTVKGLYLYNITISVEPKTVGVVATGASFPLGFLVQSSTGAFFVSRLCC